MQYPDSPRFCAWQAATWPAKLESLGKWVGNKHTLGNSTAERSQIQGALRTEQKGSLDLQARSNICPPLVDQHLNHILLQKIRAPSSTQIATADSSDYASMDASNFEQEFMATLTAAW